MFKVSEKKITAVVGAILHQHEKYCLIFFLVIVFRSLETDLN